MCKALIAEKLELSTLSDNWGGGFEMIYFDGNKFIKMDNITYMFWHGFINLETGVYKLEPDFAYNFKYFEELLLLSVFNFPEGDKREELIKYVVPPLNKSVKEFDTSAIYKMHKLNVNNGKICNVFIFQLSDGNVITSNRFDVSEEILGVPPENIISAPGYEYMRPNGKYEPSVTFEVNYNKKSTSFEFSASVKYLDRIVKEVENIIIRDYNLSSFKLTQAPMRIVNSVAEEKLKNRIKILKIDGYSNKLIARELKVPLDTVLRYLKEVFNK